MGSGWPFGGGRSRAPHSLRPPSSALRPNHAMEARGRALSICNARPSSGVEHLRGVLTVLDGACGLLPGTFPARLGGLPGDLGSTLLERRFYSRGAALSAAETASATAA